MLQQRDLFAGDFCRRCQGKPAIKRSMMALALRVARFSRHRASSDEAKLWAAKVFDALTAIINERTT